MNHLTGRFQFPLLSLLIAACLLSGCVHKHPDIPIRQPIEIERLETIPDPGNKGELVSELVKAHNGVVAIANKRAALAETLDKEAGKRQQEVAKLKAAIQDQAQSHVYENFGHWLLEGGLVSALIILGLAI